MSFVNEIQTKPFKQKVTLVNLIHFNPINEPLHPNRQLIFLKSHADAI